MPTTARLVAAGQGWRVTDLVCDSGPQERPYEEIHEAVCVALITRGTFQYRTSQGSAVLSPGAVLLGNHHRCYQCGHEHAAGDRCLAFHYSPGLFERIRSDVPGARSEFTIAALPPTDALIAIQADAQAAHMNPGPMEEIAFRLAGTIVSLTAREASSRSAPSSRDERRITGIIRWIEANGIDGNPTLTGLAHKAAMSPYHFLRVFKQVVGVTPHRYLLHLRLRRAAVQLRNTNESVAAVAFSSGFNDLSTFNHRFRGVMGMTPLAYRGRRSATESSRRLLPPVRSRAHETPEP